MACNSETKGKNFFLEGKFFFIFSTLANGHFGMLQSSLALLEVP